MDFGQTYHDLRKAQRRGGRWTGLCQRTPHGQECQQRKARKHPVSQTSPQTGHYRPSPLSCSFNAAIAACKLRYSCLVASRSSAAVLDRSCCCRLPRRVLALSRSLISLRSLSDSAAFWARCCAALAWTFFSETSSLATSLRKFVSDCCRSANAILVWLAWRSASICWALICASSCDWVVTRCSYPPDISPATPEMNPPWAGSGDVAQAARTSNARSVAARDIDGIGALPFSSVVQPRKR